jgi:hypothetical protein
MLKYEEVVQHLSCGFGCGPGTSVVKFDAVRNFDSRLRACRIAGRENQHEKQRASGIVEGLRFCYRLEFLSKPSHEKVNNLAMVYRLVILFDVRFSQ